MRDRRFKRVALACELLEDRAVPAVMHPTFVHQHPLAGLIPDSTSAPTGESPATIRHAYGVDQVLFGSVTGDGAGQTIAIVDAFDEPNMASDLAAFDSFYGLSAPTSFKKVNQTGGSSLPGADAVGGWGVEIALDVEWAHVIAPKASILLVEANSASDTDLYTAVDTARNAAGVTAVSMSWGGDESSADSANDSHFTTPSGHAGVTFLASSGDSGAYSDTGSTTKIVGYPAASPNVVGVGGTFLSTGSGGSYTSESGWGNGTSSNNLGGSGGGISKYFSQPSYQAGVVTQSTTARTVPDVAFDADPNSGASIYDTYDDGAASPWDQVGGTSLASPMWAGVIAVADQGRALNGVGSLDGRADTLPKLYTLPSADFHDITTGNNGYAAGSGYDLVTGLGTPVVNKLVGDLAGTVTAGTPIIGSFSVSPSNVTAGTPVSLTASGVTETGGTISSVKFYRESNGTSGLQIGSDTSVGSGTQSGTTWTLSNVSTTGLANGTYAFYAVATDTTGVSSSPSSAILTVGSTSSSGTILAWDVNGQSNYGTQGLAAGTVATGVTNSTGLTRGPGVGTSGTAAQNAWGGNNWASTSSAGISAGKSVTFGLTVEAGHTLSISSLDMNYRHSPTGPNSGYWQYQVNGGAWNLIGDFSNEFSSSSSSGGAIPEINLSGISGLQNIGSGSTVTFRVTPYGSTGSAGTWYAYDKPGNDLVVNGSVSGGSVVSNAFSNWTAISAAIAHVPESAGQLTSTSVVNFGTTVYSGPLNVKNTLDRIRANNGPDRSNDGAVFNNNTGQLPSGHGTWYEFTVEPAGGTNINFANSPYNVSFPGPMRIVMAADGDTYFTGDHYSTFQVVFDPTAQNVPTIGSFTVSPTSVVTGSTVTLTASNVAETGGTISSVAFYRESNGTSGLQIGSDTSVGSGTQSGTTWTLSNVSTTGLAAGTYTFYAVATDTSGVSSAVSSTTLTVTGPPVPTIGSFTVSPTSVVTGGTFTLTAGSVTETGGTISSVNFYRESNGTSGLQIGSDTSVGSGTQSGTTWTLSNVSTTGLTAGTYTFYAVATDTNGVTSAVPSATLTVTTPVPTIGSFTVSPTSVVTGSTVTLTASNVTETGGTVSSVAFYRESNGTSGLQIGSDTSVGSGTQSGTTWTLSNVSTTGLAAGTYTFYAVATDTSGVSSAVSSTTLTVTSGATSGTIVGWNVAGQTNFGTQGLGADTVAGGVTNSTGLTRGSGVQTNQTAASNAWGGNNWASTSAAGISGGEYITFGMTVSAGHTLSLSSLDLFYRHSGTGPTNGLWQYQLNGGTWVTIADITNEFSSSSSSGAQMAQLSLSGVSGLQNVGAGTVVTFRLVPYGATGSGGTWYVYDKTGDDLVVTGSV
jgi:hypothetical protein